MVQTVESRQNAQLIGAGFVLGAIAVILVNMDIPEGESGGTGEMVATLVFLVILAIAMYLLLPRLGRPGMAGIVVGVVAFLTIAVFWSGIPFLLGATAFALGRRASSEGTRATIAQVLGAVAVAGAVGAVIFERAT